MENPKKLKMVIIVLGVMLVAFMGLSTWATTAQGRFTEAEQDDIKSFLAHNFGNTNAAMVIGLVDERSSRVLAAGKLDNGTR